MSDSERVSLVCRECGAEYPATRLYICKKCFAPLDVKYDIGRTSLSKNTFFNRKKTLWRYYELLPVLDKSKIVDMGAGYSPLIESERLAKRLGLRKLFIKNDIVNPTCSFKDRPSAVAVSKALEFGLTKIGCASTGNLAAALAAHAAKAGLTCYAFIPKDLEPNKILQMSIYDPEVVIVEGTYDETNRLAMQVAENYGLAIANVDLRPYYVEGSKTLAFEVSEQLEWGVPDHVIVPAASGALYCATFRGFKELERVGLVKDVDVRISLAQPSGCSHIVTAFKNGKESITPINAPKTIAKSLAVGSPGDGVYALRKLRECKGFAEEAADKEIIEAIRLLAKTEGIFAEPAGGVTVAVLKKLIDEGKIGPDETVVCFVTGGGLKTPELMVDGIKEARHVRPTLQSLKLIMGGI